MRKASMGTVQRTDTLGEATSVTSREDIGSTHTDTRTNNAVNSPEVFSASVLRPLGAKHGALVLAFEPAADNKGQAEHRDANVERREEFNEAGDDEDREECVIDNPSTDIRGDLEEILGEELEYNGTFSFHRAYANAPNPVLRVEGLGDVGLPLSTRDAQAIIGHSKHAPFGKGAQTVVDTGVRDTWEIDASQVHFDNPDWDVWMQNIVKEVCVALGVDLKSAKPRHEPYKLLLYETGSHFLPHKDTEKAAGMFATIVVVLPSFFTGGVAVLKHGELGAHLDSGGPKSRLRTSVLSWYTDVTHEITPVTTGYRLAISYNLVHTNPTGIRASLPVSHAVVEQLRHVLLSWKQSPAKPQKIICLLDHHYAQASLKRTALKGVDAHRVAVLEMLAKRHHFHLALAGVVCQLSGRAKGEGGRRYRNSYGESDIESDEDPEMGDVDEREMTIEHMVDLDGTLIRDELPIHYKEGIEDDPENLEFIPVYLREDVEDGDPDHESYEGFQGNAPGTMEQWYRRTVLVIWPHANNAEIAYDDDPSQPTEILCQSTSPRPTKEELVLVRHLLGRVDDKTIPGAKAIKGLHTPACRWGDLKLWLRSIASCNASKRVQLIGVAGIITATRRFGFMHVRSFLEDVLKYDPTNTGRYTLLKALVHLSAESPAIMDATWAYEKRDVFFKTLSKPSASEVKLIIEMSRDDGGVPLLRDVITPQLTRIADPSCMISFATSLHSGKEPLCYSETDTAEVDRVVAELLASAISKTDFFTPIPGTAKPATQPYYYSYLGRPAPPQDTPTPALALHYVKVCMQTGNPQLAGDVIQKLVSSPADIARQRAVTVLLPLVTLLKQFEATLDPSSHVPRVAELSLNALHLYMQQIQTRIPTPEEFSSIFEAVALSGGFEIFRQLIVPRIKLVPVKKALSLGFIQHLYAHEAKLHFSPDELSWVFTELVEDFLGRSKAIDHTAVLDLLKLCLETGNYRHVGRLIHESRKMEPSGTFCRSFIEQLTAHEAKTGFRTEDGVSVPTISEELMDDLIQRSYIATSSRTVIDLLNLSLDVGYVPTKLFARVLRPDGTSMTSEYITDFMVPLLTDVRDVLQRRKISVTTDPYRHTFKHILLAFVDKILGPKPADPSVLFTKVVRTMCTCQWCSRVATFLATSSLEKEITFERIGAPMRRHVEDEVRYTYGWSIARSDTVRTSSPQGIRISKAKALYAPLQWEVDKARALTIMARISPDESTQRRILGKDYQDIMNRINGLTAV